MFFHKKATKSMKVSDIISTYPHARGIMSASGIKFIGKDLSPLEPLEKVARGNGLDSKAIDIMMDEINNYKESKELTLEVTENAAAQLKETLKRKQKKAVRLRLYSDGCALYTYDMDFTNVRAKNDIELKVSGVTFFVEKKSTDFLNGTRIRYDTVEQGFIFENPNVKK